MKSIRYVHAFFVSLAFLFLVLAIVGMFRNYTPVPFWDMWDGYLDFYVKVSGGDWSQWFAQHNEHRIVLSRILFYIDLHFFKGTLVFLLVANFVLLTLFVLLMILISRDLELYKHYGSAKYLVLVCFILCFGYFWAQHANLVWGFQSQFIMAYLLPMASFYSLYKDATTLQRQPLWFISSVILGLLSAGTMANGVIALPVLFILALTLRVSKLKLLIIFISAVIVIGLYFHGYHSNPEHGSLVKTLVNHPIEFFLYILTYLGNPFYYVFFRSLGAAQFLGALFIFVSFFTFFRCAVKQTDFKSKALLFALFASILYLAGTALGTAGGRALFGLHQAVSSRYVTPLIFGWISLLLILASCYKDSFRRKQSPFYLLAFIIVLMTSIQLEAFKSHKNEVFDQKVAALALEMNVRDEEYTKKVFPFLDWLEKIAKPAKQQKLSIFGNSMISSAGEMIGKVYKGKLAIGSLNGGLTGWKNISKVNRFNRITGWINKANNTNIPKTLLVLNPSNREIVGYVLVEGFRSEIGQGLTNIYRFTGYVKKGHFVDGELVLLDSETGFGLKTKIPSQLVTNDSWKEDSTLKFASVEDIDNARVCSWRKNAEFRGENRSGFVVYGSYVGGDKYIGQISLALNKGSTLLYKTGPKSRNQKIIISSENGEFEKKYRLPRSEQWAELELNDKSMPKKLVITLKDEGKNWGEWSAVMLKKQ